MDDRPQARREGIISESVGDDVVVYDQVTQTAHSLSATAALVWDVCDGKRSPQEIAQKLGLEPNIVTRAVTELSECGLLDHGRWASESDGISRREAAKRLAVVGGAAVVAPLIYSVAVPATAMAHGSGCTLGITNQTNSAQCTAAAGDFGTSDKGTGSVSTCCQSGSCYQGASNNKYYCVANTNTCIVHDTGNGSANTCSQDSDCCAPLAGNCTGGTHKKCTQ